MINILLVEDDLGDQRLFREAIEETCLDHQLRSAASGDECLKMVAAQKPDMIFMDVIMPGLSGVDFVRILHRDPATRDIPVVFLTGMAGGNQNKDGGNKWSIGGTFFSILEKPVDAKKLMNIISKIRHPER